MDYSVTHDAKFSVSGPWFPVTRIGRMLIVWYVKRDPYDTFCYAPRSAAVVLDKRINN